MKIKNLKLNEPLLTKIIGVCSIAMLATSIVIVGSTPYEEDNKTTENHTFNSDNDSKVFVKQK